MRDFIGDVDGYLMKQATAGDIVKNLPALYEVPASDSPEVVQETDINTLFKYFSTHDTVIVAGEDGPKPLSRQDLFKYLSKNESGDVR